MLNGREAVRSLPAIRPFEQSWPAQICSFKVPARCLVRYRLTAADYQRPLHAQGGVCAICGGANWRNDQPAPLSVDHDHVCCVGGKRTCGRCVRGLLCSTCNGFLGELELAGRGRYDAGWEAAAMEYLEQRDCDPSAPYRRFVLREQHRARSEQAGTPCTFDFRSARW
ncbi:endonuclease domain-containing protein [Micromonospora sp. LA-10]|uniref:endonuclease domain-containing protein n=1 Tax=Micromonospora sp. LA-10 TaxID=3446364 RepID=UPI003F70CBED